MFTTAWNHEQIKKDFPFLQKERLHYLDNAATTQKPQAVINALLQSVCFENANVHRGVYALAELATSKYELGRQKLAEFIGAKNSDCIILTSGSTLAFNMIAKTWGETFLKEGDEVVLTMLEHHSNIVPWQMLAAKKKIVLKFIPLKSDARLDLEAAKSLITKKTKLLSFSHVSNVLGYIQPIKKLIDLAKEVGAVTVIDGAQAVAHLPIDVTELDCDFYIFSAHKMLGPSGLGVLYGKREILEKMPPFLGGGEMIAKVTTSSFTLAPIPHRFEAGTPPIHAVHAVTAAVSYLACLDRKAQMTHELKLAEKAYEYLARKNIRLLQTPGEDWIGTVTFSHKEVHPHDIAAILDSKRVCIRAGNHCAQPLHQFLGIDSSLRISPYIYNDEEDIEKFIEGMEKIAEIF